MANPPPAGRPPPPPDPVTNLESQIKVAEMYKEGIGTDKDLDKSAYWLKRIEDSK